eukprot:209991_1
MPIDIKFLRENPKIVEKSQKRRFKDVTIVKTILQIDNEWKKTLKHLDQINKNRNAIQKNINQIYKRANKENKRKLTEEEQKQIESLNIDRQNLENDKNNLKQQVTELENKRNTLLNTIGNIVHDTVPISTNEEKDNAIIRKVNVNININNQTPKLIIIIAVCILLCAITIGNKKPLLIALTTFTGILIAYIIFKYTNQFKQHKIISNNTGYYHDQLLYMIGGYDREHGSKVAGNKAYYLTGPAVLLNIALQHYGIDFLCKRKFKPVQPPYFMNKNMMAKTAQLDEFDETLYHVTGEKNDKEKYLIATSEQPISALHCNNKGILTENDLPIRYAGISTCFRKEAGAGNDFCGIFRVHQFEKIEQFVYCEATESWNMLEELITNAEEFYKSLGIGYRVVNIVSGKLNNAAAMKYDLEGWFPVTGRYRELVSASNCTNYQAKAMETTYIIDKNKEYVHMLNATLVATTRTICVILENYQTDKGIIVPKVLRPYMNGMEFIPFVRKVTDHNVTGNDEEKRDDGENNVKRKKLNKPIRKCDEEKHDVMVDTDNNDNPKRNINKT